MYFRPNIILPILFLSLLTLNDCDPETEISRDYPLVKTLAVDSVTEEGAIFSGRIIGLRDDVDEYGFVWGNSIILNIRESERIYHDGVPDAFEYSFAITGQFENYRTYYVSAYVRSDELIIYGNTLEFSIKKSLNP